MAAEEPPNAGYLEAIRAQNARIEAEVFYFGVLTQSMDRLRRDHNPPPVYLGKPFQLKPLGTGFAQRRLIQQQMERERKEDGDDDGD